MNCLIEKGVVVETLYGANFSFTLSDNSSFLPTEYKVLQGQTEDTFLKCMKMMNNGKLELYYLTEGYKPLSDLLEELTPEKILTIVTDLFVDAIKVKSIGFLSCQSIDTCLNHVYVNTNTYKTKLVYLPLSNRLFGDYSSFENDLRTRLVKAFMSYKNLSSTKTDGLLSDLSNGMYSLDDICKRLHGGAATKKEAYPSQNEKDEHNCKLVAIGSPHRTEIEVSKAEFIIGKKAESVDGVVSFNPMISRVHCKILFIENTYYIVDLKSANGTYVNRVKLQPNARQKITNGDIVRLANSDFQVVIS